ncbi:MAG: hypothetical protein AAB922_04385 [Patescibacteria group bacterium]
MAKTDPLTLYMVVNRLMLRDRPLTAEECRSLGRWLKAFIEKHDRELLAEVFLEVKKEDAKEVPTRSSF